MDYNFSEEINTGTTSGDGKGAGLRTNMRKLSENDNYLKQEVEELKEYLGSVVSGLKGPIYIADIKTEDGYYPPLEAGTYPNAGGLVYDPEGVDKGYKVTFIKSGAEWVKDRQFLSVVVDGVVEEGNTQAISGGEVYNHLALKADQADLIQLAGDVAILDSTQKIDRKLFTEQSTYRQLQNIITNGNFDNINGWSTSPGYPSANAPDLSVSDNILTATLTSVIPTLALVQDIIPKPNHVYFARFDFKSHSNSDVVRLRLGHNVTLISVATQEWVTFSHLWKSNATVDTTITFRVEQSVSSFPIGAQSQYRKIILIDLTEIFGAGNEPTEKGDIDYLIESTPNQWFDDRLSFETFAKNVEERIALKEKIDLYSMYKPVENIIVNSGLTNTAYWTTYIYLNITASNGTLSTAIITPLGLGNNYVLRNPVTPILGHKYYYKYSILPKYAGYTRLSFGQSTIDGFTPMPNQWNEKSGIINLDVQSSFDPSRIFSIYHNMSVDYEVGDSVQLKNILLIDLTETFGIGNEPTSEWIEQNILFKYADMWFDGVIPVKTVTEIGDDFYKYKSDNDALLAGSQNKDVLTSNGDGTAEYKPITALLPNPDNLESSSGRSATATIAAFDSNIKTKEFADYVCSGVDDQIIINEALNYAEGGKAILLEGTYNLSAPLLPPNNTEVEIVGKISVSNTVEDIIVQDAVIGQNYVVVSDGSKFKAGDYVAFYDDNSEVQSGSGGQTRRHSNAGYITSVNVNTLSFDGNLIYAITASANPKIGTMFSAILIENKENIYVHGAGTLDGRKASQFDCDPVSMALGGEDIRVGCCISIKYGANIRVSGLTMMNGILHNFVSSRSKNTTITHTTCLYAHDKNILYFYDDNFKAAYNTANYAEFEDGIIGYMANTNAVIVGNYCEGNNRYGFRFGATDMDATSMGNIAIKGNGASFSFGAKRMTSLGDVSKNGKSTSFDTLINGDYVTLHGFKVVNPDGADSGLFITGGYCRIYGGHVLMNKLASRLNRGLALGSMGDSTPSNAIIDGVNIESCKTGIFADASVVNCRVKNQFLIDNTTDVSDLSSGGLIIES